MIEIDESLLEKSSEKKTIVRYLSISSILLVVGTLVKLIEKKLQFSGMIINLYKIALLIIPVLAYQLCEKSEYLATKSNDITILIYRWASVLKIAAILFFIWLVFSFVFS
ncbi:MAG: hypothetical protein J0M08_03525 [Bacteroidetes bacterium]|nr:hypothetical protein [Bacteroidota bacterium]